MAKEYRLVPSKLFLKDLAKLPVDMRSKVDKALLELKNDPHSARSLKKLTNVDAGAYRLRIGDFRLRFDIEANDIKLHTIRHRKDVYRGK